MTCPKAGAAEGDQAEDISLALTGGPYERLQPQNAVGAASAVLMIVQSLNRCHQQAREARAGANHEEGGLMCVVR